MRVSGYTEAMSGKRYTTEEREKALGMLAASETDDGPQLSAVSRKSGVPISTLKGWWDKSKHSPQGDGKHRKRSQAASHAREQIAAAGSAEWLEAQRLSLAERIDKLTESGEWVRHQITKLGVEIIPLEPDRQALTALRLVELFKDFEGRVLPVTQTETPDLNTDEGRDQLVDMLRELPADVLRDALKPKIVVAS